MLMEVRKRLSEAEKAAMLEALAPLAERQATLSRRSQALLASAGQDAPERRWYVLRVSDRAEKAVDKVLHDAGVECWLPVSERVPMRRGGRSRAARELVDVLAWPGYLFVKVVNCARTWAGLATVKGVLSVLGTAESPAPISDKMVLKLKWFVENDDAAITLLSNAISEGDEVNVDDGPFASFPGVMIEDLQHGRVRVEVMIFGRAVLVELDLAQISKAD